MKIRAVLFDIYKTLLEVGPPPSNAAALWEQMGRDKLGGAPRLTLDALATACEQVIAREHAAARAAGIAHPEIFWPAVMAEALPELQGLEGPALEDFLFAHAQLQRTVGLAPETIHILESLVDRGVWLGLVSNCQSYTLYELATVLDGTKLSLASFQPDLCFLSYKQGFSKPDPHVFRLLTARLLARGILPVETLVVGDRPDNDIGPARAQGFQTWLLTKADDGKSAGDWKQLGNFLSRTA